MAVLQITDDTFDGVVRDGICIVDFYSTHCGPCRVLLPQLLRLEADMPFINLVKVNTDDCLALAQRFHIAAVPTIYLGKDGCLQEYYGELSYEGILQALGKLIYE